MAAAAMERRREEEEEGGDEKRGAGVGGPVHAAGRAEGRSVVRGAGLRLRVEA